MDKDFCEYCEKEVESGVEDPDTGRIYCGLRCKAEAEAQAEERNYDRFMERFYGGSAPVTAQERYQRDSEAKRRMR